MKMHRMGGLEVSAVGLGTNNFDTDFFGKKCDQADVTRIIHAALDVGITLIDTAEEYSVTSHIGTGRSEQAIGIALGSRRDDVVIASKFSSHDADHPDERGAKRIIRAVEGSLRRLGTDRIDLYQQHNPDPGLPIDEVLEALTRLVQDGKVVAIGCCNFSGAMIDEAVAASGEVPAHASFVSAQNQYNLLDPPTQDGVIEACSRHDLKLLAYFPLASGLLTGKYSGGTATPPPGSRFDADTRVANHLRQNQLSDRRIAIVGQLDAYARSHGHTILDLAISWLTSQAVVGSVLVGASSPEQIRTNAAAACWELSGEDFQAVQAIITDTNADANQ